MPDFLVFTAILNKISGANIILDIHDNMPEIYKAKFNSFLSNIFYKVLLFQEKMSCAFSDTVITVHEPHLEHNVKYHGLSREKTRVIKNFADTKLFNKNNFSGRISGQDNIFRLIYHGTIAERFNLRTVLEGLSLSICHQIPIYFDIYGKGDGVPELIEQISKLNLSRNVKFHGQISLDLLPKKIAASDLGIVSYLKSEATDLMLPLKLMEYIAMGLPVLTVENKAIKYYFKPGELEYFSSGDSNSFSEKLIGLINSPQRLSKLKMKTDVINQRMNWTKEKIQYLDIIRKHLKD